MSNEPSGPLLIKNKQMLKKLENAFKKKPKKWKVEDNADELVVTARSANGTEFAKLVFRVDAQKGVDLVDADALREDDD
jgi:hypothetical protein